MSHSSGPEPAAPPLLPGDAEQPEPDSRPVTDWTLDDIVELARGAYVQCDGDPGAIARVMAAVEPVARELTRIGGVTSSINNVHVADRPAIVDAWREARTNPGTVVPVQARSNNDGVWRHTRQRMLSLLEHPTLPIFLIIGDRYEVMDDPGLPFDQPALQGRPAKWSLVRLRPDGRVSEAAMEDRKREGYF